MVLVTDFDQCQTKWHPPCGHYPVITLFIITVITVHRLTLTCPVTDLRSDIPVTCQTKQKQKQKIFVI
ncbi:hypothetical protein DPMN_104918 [Dreissena polymorpha]|uniref:Uncharacterized protein n=1 Tax=Dreissena polymorpha TaxID=45954 RepID=A0A9D4K361_DREPO|nr:hypothetical protein DPMN_104918 [Dreissena polymorpha]